MRNSPKGKFIAAMASIAVAAGLLAGCAGPAEADKTGSEEGAPYQGSKDENYYMLTFLSGDPFWKDTFRGFEDAAELLGVKAHYGGATEYDVNLAIQALEQTAAKKPQGIAVTAMDADAYVDPINRIVESGTNLVTFDADAPASDRLAFLGTGNYAAGSEAAHGLAKLYPETEEVKVGVVTTLGQTNLMDRLAGFQDTIAANYPNIEVVEVADSGADETSASQAASNLIKANPDLNAIFPALVLAQVGTLTALEEANLTDKVKVITFDSHELTLRNIEAGKVAFTIAQGPYHMGYWSMMMLYAVEHDLVNPVENWRENGISPLPPLTDTGAFLIDPDNVQAYLESIVTE